MNFNVTINILHADGTITDEFRVYEPPAGVTREELGVLVEYALRDARKLERDASKAWSLALDLTITEAR